jgi:hypothetical protein
MRWSRVLLLSLAAACTLAAQATLPNGLELVRFEVRTAEPALAGPGNTWLILRLWLRGNTANAGMPENFY